MRKGGKSSFKLDLWQEFHFVSLPLSLSHFFPRAIFSGAEIQWNESNQYRLGYDFLLTSIFLWFHSSPLLSSPSLQCSLPFTPFASTLVCHATSHPDISRLTVSSFIHHSNFEIVNLHCQFTNSTRLPNRLAQFLTI